jgi:hypothetical protein
MTGDIKCPVCSSKTILRIAKKGPDAGKKFHVCVNHPKCNGKVEQAKANRLIGRIRGNHESSIRILERSKRFNLENPLNKSKTYLGAFIAVLLTNIAPFILVGAVAILHLSYATWIIILFLGIGLIGYPIGGFIAGRMAEYRGYDHGARAAEIACVINYIIYVIIAIVSILVEVNRGLDESGWMMIGYTIVGIIGSTLGLVIAILIAMILGGLGGALGARLRKR